MSVSSTAHPGSKTITNHNENGSAARARGSHRSLAEERWGCAGVCRILGLPGRCAAFALHLEHMSRVKVIKMSGAVERVNSRLLISGFHAVRGATAGVASERWEGR
jgi:hypothetical protein